MSDIDEMKSAIQKMAGDLGCGPLKFEADAHLSNYKKGKPMTFGELRTLAKTGGVAWLKLTEDGKARGSSAKTVSLTGSGDFFFDNGSCFATDMSEDKKPDSELAIEYCSGWTKAVFHAKKITKKKK